MQINSANKCVVMYNNIVCYSAPTKDECYEWLRNRKSHIAKNERIGDMCHSAMFVVGDYETLVSHSA